MAQVASSKHINNIVKLTQLFYSVIMQTSDDIIAVETSYITKCPTHPYPSPLPSPLPGKIESAISLFETQLANLVEEDTLVCSYNKY